MLAAVLSRDNVSADDQDDMDLFVP